MVNDILLGEIENKVSILIDSIYGNNASVNLKFYDVTDLANTRDAETINEYSVTDDTHLGATINLNKNILPNASKEFIAATILHEALHAYIGVNYYAIDHEEMAKSYVNTMADILQGMFSSLSRVHALSLSWGGLEGTSYFTNPPTGLTIPTNQATINGNYRNKTLGHGCN